MKKQLGKILIVIGIVLTMDRTQEFKGVLEQITFYLEQYWTIFIFLLGLYLLTSPERKRK